MNAHRCLPVLLLAALALPASGDVVHLKNGNTLEGRVERTPEAVVVKLAQGEVRISPEAVARIEKTPDAEAMKARGLVQVDGQWMSPEAAARLRELEAQLQTAREERQAAEAQLQQALQEPPLGWNPYDQYYATRDLDRYRQRAYYYAPYSTYYAPTPYAPVYGGPYGSVAFPGFWFGHGPGRVGIAGYGRIRHR